MTRFRTLSALLLALAVAVGVAGLARTKLPAQAATTTPIRAAFYYPWFPETWHPSDHYHPSPGQYSSDDASVVNAQFAWMHYAGMDAAISSWWGKGRHAEQTRFPAEMKAAAANGMTVAPYYEKEGQANTPLATIQSDLTYLKAYVRADPAGFLHVDGKPVIFVYNAASATSTCATVTKWSQATSDFADWYVVMKVFGGYTSCAHQPSSWHQYGPAAATDRQGSYSYSISPGFWKHGESKPRLARDETRWKADVDSMRSSGARWQLVTTFNEWGEGTSVEPAREWSTGKGGGDYLRILHDELGTTSTAPPSPLPTPVSPPPLPATGHKVLTIIGENHSQSEALAQMPHLSGWASTYGQATAYKAITHPSLPNYLAIAEGSASGVADDNGPSSHPISGDSVFDQTIAAGRTAKTYAETMPSNCDLSSSGDYAVKHNPWPYNNGAVQRANCKAYDVPMGTYSSGNMIRDVKAGRLPVTGLAVPNLCNDAHDCSLATFDSWLNGWIPKIMAGPDYTSGRLTIVVTFDEDDSSQSNTVAFVVIDPRLHGKTVTSAADHYSLTRWYDDNAGVPPLRNAATAVDLRSAFGL